MMAAHSGIMNVNEIIMSEDMRFLSRKETQ